MEASGDEKDLNRVGDMLKRRFSIATDGSVRLNILFTKTLDFRHKIEDYPEYKNGKITDKERLESLWYYDHLGGHVLPEAYYEFKSTPEGKKIFKDIDAMLLITGAQFESLAFQIGKIAAIEQPREAGWSNQDGGSSLL